MRTRVKALRATGALWAVTLVGGLLLGGCATTAGQPWYVTTEGLPEYRAADIGEISDYPQALATTVAIMERDLQLPRLDVRLVFLPDTKSLKTVLLRSGYPPQFARETARQMVAIGGHRIVLINQARFDLRDWSWRLHTLAHELAHVLQYELGGGTRGTSAQWLREGFAEWLGIQVMVALGEVDAAKARQRAIMDVRTHARRRFPMAGPTSPYRDWMDRAQDGEWIPELGDLVSFPDWVEQSRAEGGPVLYDYAFLAVAFLLEEHGVPAAIRYFELFAARQDHTANFLEAFGEPEEEFEKRLRAIM